MAHTDDTLRMYHMGRLLLSETNPTTGLDLYDTGGFGCVWDIVGSVP